MGFDLDKRRDSVEWLGGIAGWTAGEEQQSFLNGFSSECLSVLPIDLLLYPFCRTEWRGGW